MYKNNKGNTVLIVSIVVGVLVLGIGGFLGYKWYQGKLAKEKIARLEKLNDGIGNVLEKFNQSNSPTAGKFTDADFINFRSDVKDYENEVERLSKLNPEEEVKSEFKKCKDDAEGILKNLNVIVRIGNKVLDKTITQSDLKEIEAAANSLEEYRNLNSCEKAQDSIDEEISKLEK